MFPCRVFQFVLRRPLFLAVLGVLLLHMSGLALPILALAIVGFVLWLPLHTLLLGREHGLVRHWRPNSGRQSKPGASTLDAAAAQLASGWNQLRTWAGRVAVIVVESASGAAVGAVLLMLSSGVSTAHIFLGATAGAGVGALVSLHRLQTTSAQLPPDDTLASEGQS